MADDKRCGNCRWWMQNIPGHDWGDCTFPVPEKMPVSWDQERTEGVFGTDCPCFERKEASDE